jgi:hypothetical protein
MGLRRFFSKVAWRMGFWSLGDESMANNVGKERELSG